MIPKSTILVVAAISLIVGCGKNTENTSAVVEQDSLLQSKAFVTLFDVMSNFDSTGQLKEPLSGREKEKLEAIMKGKEYCGCFPHNTGQAHFHTETAIAFTANRKTPYIGLLTRYDSTIDERGNRGVKPCYLFYVNTLHQTFADCQHISTAEGEDAFKWVCINNVQVAYDLNPSAPTEHNHGNEVPDCH